MFVQHGGGPMPLLGDPGHAGLIEHLKTFARSTLLDTRPKAIVLVTAHWEEKSPVVSGGERPDLLFDYYGFPSESYSYKYAAEGSPRVSQRVFDLLQGAGLHPSLDVTRGWDHGVFVPMMLILPEGDIPIVQLSVCKTQDAEVHLRMGEALAPLRDDGIAIVGSGMTFHNMMAFRGHAAPGSSVDNTGFDSALWEACTLVDPVARRKAFSAWRDWPQADWSHPRGAAEHWMPMLVVVGAGLNAETKVSTDRFKLWDYHFTSCAFR
jgi:aromatic ring-opening dioxygenase catalytic subunit (LigB family)